MCQYPVFTCLVFSPCFTGDKLPEKQPDDFTECTETLHPVPANQLGAGQS